MGNVNQHLIDEAERFVINYLSMHDKATLREIFVFYRDKVHYFFLEDTLYKMFKKGLLRRNTNCGEGIEYALTSRFPTFGKGFKPQWKKNSVAVPEPPQSSVIDQCRENSSIIGFNKLIEAVRE